MRTSKFFNSEAVKCALREPIYLRGSGDLDKFLRFLEPRDPTCCRHIRDLRLGFGDARPDLMDNLTQRLVHMSSLETVALDFGEEFLDCFPEFGDALATLTTLRHLTISYVGELTSDLLEAMQPGLVSLDLGWLGYDEGFFQGELPYEKWSEYHPVPFLAKWSSTLEKLSCNMWYTRQDVTPFDHVYPNLRQLSIDRDEFPLIAPYVCAFPNLTTLHVETDHGEDIDDDDAAERLYEHHALNVRSQQEGGKAGTTWQYLQEYTGGLVDLYVLGLTCRIPRLFFHSVIDERHYDMLSIILSYAQPVRLNITRVRDPFLTDPTRGLAAILQDSGASALESLVVVFELSKASREVDVAAALVSHPSLPVHVNALFMGAPLQDTLAQSLKRLPLRHLRLRVSDYGLNPTPPPPSAMDIMLAKQGGEPPPEPHPPMPFTPAEVSLQSFDVEEFTKGLGDAIPTLCDAIVKVSAPRSGHRTASIKRGTTCEEFDSHDSMWEA